MIRGVVIHQQGQLPMVADVLELPGVGDANLICTNVRTTDGKRPPMVDEGSSWFVIPLMTVRFLEVPRESMAGLRMGDEGGGEELPAEPAEPVDDAPTEPDPDLLARIRDV